jgi:hypothetical protein
MNIFFTESCEADIYIYTSKHIEFVEAYKSMRAMNIFFTE